MLTLLFCAWTTAGWAQSGSSFQLGAGPALYRGQGELNGLDFAMLSQGAAFDVSMALETSSPGTWATFGMFPVVGLPPTLKDSFYGGEPVERIENEGATLTMNGNPVVSWAAGFGFERRSQIGLHVGVSLGMSMLFPPYASPDFVVPRPGLGWKLDTGYTLPSRDDRAGVRISGTLHGGQSFAPVRSGGLTGSFLGTQVHVVSWAAALVTTVQWNDLRFLTDPKWPRGGATEDTPPS